MNLHLVNYFEETGVDNRNRKICDIWLFSNDELEECHDYIQWVFPLYEKSMYNMNAPLLDRETVNHIKKCHVCQKSFNYSKAMMGKFYSENIHWMSISNHNLLRISRIIKSISILQNEEEAKRFHKLITSNCIKEKFEPSTETLQYWKKSIST